MFYYASAPEVAKFLTWPLHKSQEDTRHVIANLQKRIEEGANDGFAIHYGPSGMIGTIGMQWQGNNTGEIGYVLSKDHWGKGFVSEAAKAFVQYLWDRYELLQHIEARCFAGHKASARVMEKLGMEFMGHLPDEIFTNIHPEKMFPVWHYRMSRS
jgi:ribosomal-protein-alanine N-acetyltransferase